MGSLTRGANCSNWNYFGVKVSEFFSLNEPVRASAERPNLKPLSLTTLTLVLLHRTNEPKYEASCWNY